MFERANELLGSNWTFHDLRHTAAYHMAPDQELSLTDVRWVLGHAHPGTTGIYLAGSQEEVIEQVLAHHARRAAAPEPVPRPPAPVYRSAAHPLADAPLRRHRTTRGLVHELLQALLVAVRQPRSHRLDRLRAR